MSDDKTLPPEVEERPHTTHFDDCGCLSAKWAAAVARERERADAAERECEQLRSIDAMRETAVERAVKNARGRAVHAERSAADLKRRLAAAEAREAALRGALRGLATITDGECCWCVADGEPGHDEACLRARAALAAGAPEPDCGCGRGARCPETLLHALEAVVAAPVTLAAPAAPEPPPKKP